MAAADAPAGFDARRAARQEQQREEPPRVFGAVKEQAGRDDDQQSFQAQPEPIALLEDIAKTPSPVVKVRPVVVSFRVPWVADKVTS